MLSHWMNMNLWLIVTGQSSVKGVRKNILMHARSLTIQNKSMLKTQLGLRFQVGYLTRVKLRSASASFKNTLSHLIMANIGVRVIDDWVFEELPNLSWLDVRHNSLKSLPLTIIKHTEFVLSSDENVL